MACNEDGKKLSITKFGDPFDRSCGSITLQFLQMDRLHSLGYLKMDLRSTRIWHYEHTTGRIRMKASVRLPLLLFFEPGNLSWRQTQEVSNVLTLGIASSSLCKKQIPKPSAMRIGAFPNWRNSLRSLAREIARTVPAPCCIDSADPGLSFALHNALSPSDSTQFCAWPSPSGLSVSATP